MSSLGSNSMYLKIGQNVSVKILPVQVQNFFHTIKPNPKVQNLSFVAACRGANLVQERCGVIVLSALDQKRS